MCCTSTTTRSAQHWRQTLNILVGGLHLQVASSGPSSAFSGEIVQFNKILLFLLIPSNISIHNINIGCTAMWCYKRVLCPEIHEEYNSFTAVCWREVMCRSDAMCQSEVHDRHKWSSEVKRGGTSCPHVHLWAFQLRAAGVSSGVATKCCDCLDHIACSSLHYIWLCCLHEQNNAASSGVILACHTMCALHAYCMQWSV